MRRDPSRPRFFTRTLCLAGTLMLATVLVPAADARERRVPERFAPGLDRGLVELDTTTDGRLWSAWVYRDGAELDIALSSIDAEGVWSAPVILGADDGRDQVDPALAIDPAGTAYVVYADRTGGTLMLSALAAESRSWSEPVPLNGARGTTPAIRVLGNTLVIAYREGDRIRLTTRPLGAPDGPIGTNTIYDGPDPVGSCAEDGSCTEGEDDRRHQPKSDAGDRTTYDGTSPSFVVPHDLNNSPEQRERSGSH